MSSQELPQYRLKSPCMEKLDRLDWTDGFSFLSYGVRIGMRANNSEALSRMQESLPPGWKPSASMIVDRLYSLKVAGKSARPGHRPYNLLYGDLMRVSRSFDLEEVFRNFETDLHMHIAEFSNRRVFVHAGVVGWQGRAILLPGRSFTGKTTLVAELIQAGATYYSDEYALLDERGRVHPFARPLGLRNENGARKFSAEELGGKVGAKPLPVGLVALTTYKSGARWRPRTLSAGRGALALVDNTVSMRRQPEKALAAIQEAVSRSTIIKSMRGEAAGVADEILKLVENVP